MNGPGSLKRGAFITFEGPEGCGKSTQARLLADRLRSEGYDVVSVHEPGCTPVGDVVRDIVLGDCGLSASEGAETETFLFGAGRAELVGTVVGPALRDGKWVVSDRFGDSTAAYQGYARGYDIDRIAAVNAVAAGDISPDITFLLDIDIAAGFRRLERRLTETGHGYDRMERSSREFHERVRAGYLDLAARRPDRFSVVDAGADIDAVHGGIWLETVARFGLKKGAGGDS